LEADRVESASPDGFTNLPRNFISFYHQAYRAAVWRSRHNNLSVSGE
jgi:hypothetical protein